MTKPEIPPDPAARFATSGPLTEPDRLRELAGLLARECHYRGIATDADALPDDASVDDWLDLCLERTRALAEPLRRSTR